MKLEKADISILKWDFRPEDSERFILSLNDTHYEMTFTIARWLSESISDMIDKREDDNLSYGIVLHPREPQ